MTHYDDRIDKRFYRTDKITVTCTLHPETRYYTKNIERIGARTIFDGRETCACEGPSTLRLLTDAEHGHPDGMPEVAL